MNKDWFVIHDEAGEPAIAFLKSNVNAVVRDTVYKNDVFVVAGAERIRFENTEVKTVLANIFESDIPKKHGPP